MSAIKSFLEQQGDPSETAIDRQYLNSGTYEQKVARLRADGRRGLDLYPGDDEDEAFDAAFEDDDVDVEIDVDDDGESLYGYGLTGRMHATSPYKPAQKKPRAPKKEKVKVKLTSVEALQPSHAELVRVSYTRKAQIADLQGKPYWVHVKGRDVFVSLDQTIGSVPAWNPPGAGNMRNFKLLSWTQKMGTPSFSLPAGAPASGGACPAATGGQSISSEKSLLQGQGWVTRITGKPVILADAVCQRCYATGGNYAYGSMQLTQLMRFMWAKAAVRDGTFVDTMSWAIENANYLLEGGTVKKTREELVKGESKATTYDKERHPGRYFRIHDSGDFFNPEYLKAWKDVANNFRTGKDRITFWAPTRCWVSTWGVDTVNKVNADYKGGKGDSNLIIRPSSFHINERPPTYKMGKGWADWSVVYTPEIKAEVVKFTNQDDKGIPDAVTGGSGRTVAGAPFAWDCQAYSVKNEAHSCRNARSPFDTGGGRTQDVGCRACWQAPKLSINYTEH